MKYSIDQKLTYSRPDNFKTTGAFVAATMKKIAVTETSETFQRALRTTEVTKQGFVRMKLTRLRNYYHALPRLAAIALIIGSTGTVGAAGYAAYRWIAPTVKIQKIQQNSEGRKQYTLDSQCGAYRSGKSLQYELARSSALTDAEVTKIFQNTCDYDAAGSFAEATYVSDNDNNRFAKKKIGDTVTIYDHTNSFAGGTGNNSIFGLTLGHISALSATSITIELPVYSTANLSAQPSMGYFPNGKPVSRTVPLASDTQVWMDGKQLTLSDLRPGDTVQLVTRTRNSAQYYADIHQNGLGPQLSFDVAGIIKTTLDPTYVANIGNPAIVNDVAGLYPCYGNTGYQCVSPSSPSLNLIYAVERGASKLNPYRLDGRVTKIDGKKLTLQTRGAKRQLFTVELPYDAVASYNKTHKIQLLIGDLVQISYSQKVRQNHLTIAPGDIEFLAIVEQTQPDGTFTKY